MDNSAMQDQNTSDVTQYFDSLPAYLKTSIIHSGIQYNSVEELKKIKYNFIMSANQSNPQQNQNL